MNILPLTAKLKKKLKKRIFIFLILSFLIHLTFIEIFIKIIEQLIITAPPANAEPPAKSRIIDVEMLPVISKNDAKPIHLEDLNIITNPAETIRKQHFSEPLVLSDKNVLRKKITPTPKKNPAPDLGLMPPRSNFLSPSPTAPKPAPKPVTELAPEPVALTSAALGIKVIYPRLSRILIEEGVVNISVSTNSFGKIKKLTVLSSSGYPRLDKSATEALTHALTHDLTHTLAVTLKNNAQLPLKPNGQFNILFIFKLK